MTEGKALDPATLAQFTGSETFYRFGFRGDVLITERVGLTQLIIGKRHSIQTYNVIVNNGQ